MKGLVPTAFALFLLLLDIIIGTIALLLLMSNFVELGNWMQQSCVEGGADRRTGHTVTYDPEKQVLYVFGGSKNTRWLSDVHVLDTTTWTWTALEVMDSPAVSYLQRMFLFPSGNKYC